MSLSLQLLKDKFKKRIIKFIHFSINLILDISQMFKVSWICIIHNIVGENNLCVFNRFLIFCIRLPLGVCNCILKLST